jgi:hypothetical protein
MERLGWSRAKVRREDPYHVFIPSFKPSKALADVRDPDPITAQQMDNQPAHEKGRGLLRQDFHFRWPTYAMNLLPFAANVIEIARFHVPAGHVGFITTIWTSVVAWLGEGGQPFPISLNLPLTPWVFELLGLRLRYWLRLEGTRQLEPILPIVLATANELPGHPFEPQPTWTDNRYSWGWNHPPFKLFVPERMTLRLFVGADLQCNRYNPCPDGYRCKLGECIPNPTDEMKAAGLPKPMKWVTTEQLEWTARALQDVPTPGAARVSVAALEGAAAAAIGSVAGQSGIELAGRLAGYTQSYADNIAATENSRELW